MSDSAAYGLTHSFTMCGCCEQEYQELDTVWFMAGSLFNRYPFDVPTEAFTFKLFKQVRFAPDRSSAHLNPSVHARLVV